MSQRDETLRRTTAGMTFVVVAAGVGVVETLLAQWQQQNSVQVVVVGDQGSIISNE